MLEHLATFKFLPKLTNTDFFFITVNKNPRENSSNFGNSKNVRVGPSFCLIYLKVEELTHKFKFEGVCNIQSSLNPIAVSSFKCVQSMQTSHPEKSPLVEDSRILCKVKHSTIQVIFQTLTWNCSSLELERT